MLGFNYSGCQSRWRFSPTKVMCTTTQIGTKNVSNLYVAARLLGRQQLGSATVENTKYIFSSGDSARQRTCSV